MTSSATWIIIPFSTRRKRRSIGWRSSLGRTSTRICRMNKSARCLPRTRSLTNRFSWRSRISSSTRPSVNSKGFTPSCRMASKSPKRRCSTKRSWPSGRRNWSPFWFRTILSTSRTPRTCANTWRNWLKTTPARTVSSGLSPRKCSTYSHYFRTCRICVPRREIPVASSANFTILSGFAHSIPLKNAKKRC